MPSAHRPIEYNVVANYAAQIYVMVVGIVMAPVYLSYMGIEAYGLIGFFTMMTAWFQLFDFGLTPTLMRETARFRGGAISVETLRAFLRILELIFGVIAFAGAVAVILMANQIAIHWLNVKDIPVGQVTMAVTLMGLAVPLRWVSGLYRGVISGFERQVWLGGYNIAIATARFVGVLAVFATIGTTPVLFFGYQLVIAVVELSGLVIMSYGLVECDYKLSGKLSWRPLTGNLTFSLIIAFTATVWVVATQTDKAVLSRILPLAEYGMFSLAILAASAINAAGVPFGQALLPRLTKLVAEKDESGAITLYRGATQIVCVLVTPVVAALCFFAEPILRVWTGRPIIAHHIAPILCLYAIGNGWVALCSFPYYLQYAKGDLRLHFIGNIIFLGLLVPLMIGAALYYGAIGTGLVWAMVNGLYMLCWVPLIHMRVFKGLHWKWVMHDIIPVVVPTILVGWLLAIFVPLSIERWSTMITLVVLGVILLVVAGSGSAVIRNKVMTRLMICLPHILNNCRNGAR